MNVRPDPAIGSTIAVLGKTRGNRGEITRHSAGSKPERFEDLREVCLFGDSPPAPEQRRSGIGLVP